MNQEEERPEPVNYDDIVIPAVRNNKQKYEIEEQEEKEQEKESAVESLPPEKQQLAEPLLAYFEQEMLNLLFSKQWSQRESFFAELSSEMHAAKKIKLEPADVAFSYCLQAILIGLQDKIEKVSSAAMVALKSLVEKVVVKSEEEKKKQGLNKLLDNAILVAMEKCGDGNARVREESDRIILALAKSDTLGTLPILNHLVRGITTKPKLQHSARHISARLSLLHDLLLLYGIDNDKMPYNPVIDLAIKHLDHSSEQVRTAAVRIITAAYKLTKDQVRQSINVARSAQIAMLDELFQKIDAGQNIDGLLDKEGQRKLASTPPHPYPPSRAVQQGLQGEAGEAVHGHHGHRQVRVLRQLQPRLHEEQPARPPPLEGVRHAQPLSQLRPDRRGQPPHHPPARGVQG